MTGYDGLIFWGLVVLLCLVSLTTAREWWKLLSRLYNRAVDALKWSPYIGHITGGSSKGKHPSIPESELGNYYDQGKHKLIFPRSRRST